MAATRRATRLRKEYIYRKSLEGKQKAAYDKKMVLRQALADGKPLPTELRAKAHYLKDAVDAEDDFTALPYNRLDDEYAAAAVREPKVCVTTSREPSSRLKQFAKEVKLIFPGATRINRGNTTVKELVEAARGADFSDIVMVQETRGEPDALIISHLPYGPTVQFTMSGAVLRHDIDDVGTMSEEAPHLIFNGFSTPLGARITTVLKYLFPPPKPEAKRVLTFANTGDIISFRHHTYRKEGGGPKAEVELTEAGPRFDLMPYQITLGTLEQTTAQTEWVFKPYMNTARKRQLL